MLDEDCFSIGFILTYVKSDTRVYFFERGNVLNQYVWLFPVLFMFHDMEEMIGFGIWLLWLGGFIAYSLHLVIHIIQSIIIKQYILAVFTSIIALPISIWVIYQSVLELNCKMLNITLYSILGIAIVGLNLKFAQFLMGKFTKWKENL